MKYSRWQCQSVWLFDDKIFTEKPYNQWLSAFVIEAECTMKIIECICSEIIEVCILCFFVRVRMALCAQIANEMPNIHQSHQ